LSTGVFVLVAVMLDDMALKKEIEFNPSNGQFTGFVDIGLGPAISDPAPARDVLVIMAVGVNSHFKVPIGYFFIAGLSGSQRASLVSVALEKIHETGARAISLTCDGPSTHFAMLQSLGASLCPGNIVSYFSHPSDDSIRVHAFLDVVHMLKLVRNSLGSEQEILSPSGGNKLFG